MKTSRLNGLTTRIAIVFILALGAMNFNGYAQAYYDGFAFDGSNGCPVIQGGDKAQCLYIIKTDVKLIPNSTSLEIFVGDKKVR